MNNKILVLVGVVLTIVGLFLPIANTIDAMTGAPKSINFLLPDGSLGDGIVTLGLAIVAALLAIFNLTKHAVWPALIGLCYLVWRFLEIKGAADQASELVARFSPETAQAAGVGVNFLGWGVLFVGTVLTLAAAAMAWKGPAAAPPPAA
jgi:hypothetical protein